MNNLKSPEEYIRRDVPAQYSIYEIMINLTDDDIIEMMEKMQRDAYNKALSDAVNNVKLKCKQGHSGEFLDHWSIDKNSITKLKIK